MSSFNRPNISYEVRFKDSLDATSPGGAMANLVGFIQEQHVKAAQRSIPCSGIVYCHKRQDTEDLATQVAKETGIRTAPYHAGMKDAERKAVQEAWTSGAIQVAFATVAFG
jgi:superfamily II DNA helicase RecQ